MAKKAKKQKKDSGSTIVLNRSARHEFFVEEKYEAGIALEGWEVKALREGRVQFADSYVLLKDNEAFLFGCQISPLPTVSTHVTPDPLRTRKLGLVEEGLVPRAITSAGGIGRPYVDLARVCGRSNERRSIDCSHRPPLWPFHGAVWQSCDYRTGSFAQPPCQGEGIPHQLVISDANRARRSAMASRIVVSRRPGARSKSWRRAGAVADECRALGCRHHRRCP